MAQVAIRIAAAAALSCLLLACAATERMYQVPAGEAGAGEPSDVWARFEGSEGVASYRLHRVIEDYMYDFARDPTREAPIVDAASDLEDLYLAEGYPEATVDYEITEVVPTPEDEREGFLATFRIEEGPFVTVKEIRLFGTGPVDREELLGLWFRRNAGLFGTGDPIFVEADIVGFARSLQVFYRFAGNRDALVADPQIEREEGGTEAVVTIRIDSGPVYEISEVEVAEELVQALGENEPPRPRGEIASARVLEQYRLSVHDALRRRGYPDPQLRLTLETDREVKDLTVRIEGTPGRKGRIVSIELQGNEFTTDSVILSRLTIDVGQQYDGSKIDDSLREIYATGLFNKVEMKKEWLSEDPADERLALTVSTEEQDTRTLDLLAGWGSYEKLRGMAKLTERNLLGTGRALSFEGRVSTKGYRAVVSLTDRGFLDLKNSLTISGFNYSREEPSYIDRGTGLTVALRRPLTRRLSSTLGYSYGKRSGTSPVVGIAALAPESFTEGDVFLESRYEARDNVIYPRSGFTTFLGLDSMNPAFAASVDFFRIRFNASAYIPITNGLNLALRTDQGWLWPGDGSVEIPIQERFFNGGENTVRSFRQSQLGPKDINGNPTGGEFRNVFNVELRAPLVWLLEGALFFDAGNVGVLVSDYSLQDLSYGIGFGVRLALPIGPVRVDTAWNPDPQPGDEDVVVHFSVGYPF